MFESFLYKAEKPGTNLIIIGGMHGDEPGPPKGIRSVMERIENGTLPLSKGSVRFVPVANPEAHEKGVRHVGMDFNRVLRKTENPETYEAKLANELCTRIDEADALVDLHTSYAKAPVNVFVDYPTPQNIALASALGAEFAIYDWPRVYENNPHHFDSYTSDWYAHEAGKVGILFECGQHQDPDAVRVAEETVIRSLVHLGICEAQPDHPQAMHTGRAVYMKQIFARESENDIFLSNWGHLELVAAGTLIAKRASGEEIIAERESIIIFPKPYAVPGGEWFYLGTLDQP